MERKVLWLVSFAVIFILWLKIDPVAEQAKTNTAVEVSTDNVPMDDDNKQSKVTESQSSKQEQEYFESHPITTEKPDFAAITDIKQRKQAFFEFLAPFVEEKNELLLRDRETIKQILANEEPPSREEKRWLKALRELHNLKDVGVYLHEDVAELLTYVDIIPTSMVLAQAANESAWGTSRFAVEGNNYFGQWCFRKGCGLVPSSREEDADHEVRKFNDARESVFAYVDNLNSNPAYRELRQIRAQLRAENKPVTGLELVHGLDHYSQRGQEYIDEIESLIEYNQLWRFNLDHQIAQENTDEAAPSN
ncbi:flagellar biosynthesis protein FlgJ [Maribrevibacterium harenarium]|uniref:Flagellar biosynthesis protein FlgJ n=1 Tax=Maribrevibacterium harenarium TaxID=2589817 RepID=A0A501X2H4_9GAMM|nr:glucosaminidase domain-containing protein [Maribrevibacterium harenarium]TPE54653.1 flagellar biosynthesis protein FlgJ [Maribrevibacterium harenarium]